MNSIIVSDFNDNRSINLSSPLALPIQKPDGDNFKIKSQPQQAPSLIKQTTNDFLNQIFKERFLLNSTKQYYILIFLFSFTALILQIILVINNSESYCPYCSICAGIFLFLQATLARVLTCKPGIYLFNLVLSTTLISILASISLIIFSSNSSCKDKTSNYTTKIPTKNESNANSSCNKTLIYGLPIGIIIMGILSTLACVAYSIYLWQLNVKIRKIQIDQNAITVK